LGFGYWGLGIGDWAQSPIPNPQSPIPNPQIPIFIFLYKLLIIIFINFLSFLNKCKYNIYEIILNEKKR